MLKKYVVKASGEVLTSKDIIEIIDIKQTINFKNSNEYMKENLGSFFHLFYKKLFDLKLEPQMMIRFLYLSSYCEYDSNKLLLKNNKRNHQSMKENQLQDILKLSERETTKTKKTLQDKSLIVINHNKEVIVNKEYVIKGIIKIKGELMKTDIVRMFDNGIKELYENTKARQHKRLATFIQVLPYINIYYNIICKNPLEKDIDKVEPLNWTELSRKIGLSETQTKRLRAELWPLKVNGNIVIGEFSTLASSKSIIVNPSVYYKGNDKSKLEGIINLFKLGIK